MSVNATSVLPYQCYIISISLMSIRAILLLPTSTFVLVLGLQKWGNKRGFKPASHSEVFTHHLAVMELLWVFGFLCKMCVEYFNVLKIKTVGYWAASFTFYGEMLFHILTCAERYIAAVHPIAYMWLKGTRGVRFRNISLGSVWLLCLILIGLTSGTRTILLYCLLVLTLIVTSFCSASVLCVLVRPGPGEGSVEKRRTNQSKQRAFYTITAISGMQWLWFIGLFISTALTKTSVLNSSDACFIETSLGFCNLPSSLVLPLLYFLRAGILSRSRFNHG